MVTGKQVDRLARLVSAVFNPFIVTIAGGLLVLDTAGIPLETALRFTGLGVAVVVLPLYASVKIAERRYGTLLSSREERPAFYGLALLLSILFLGINHLLGTPQLFIEAVYAGIIGVSSGLAVNRYTKPSIHSGVLSGTAAMTFLQSPWRGAAVLAAVIIVGWSRVRLGEHTTVEVILGAAIATASVTLVTVAV